MLLAGMEVHQRSTNTAPNQVSTAVDMYTQQIPVITMVQDLITCQGQVKALSGVHNIAV